MGIGPLALIAKQAGYEVSGSDQKASQYLEELKTKGITDISIGQSGEELASLHATRPVDWYVYSSAVKEDNPELLKAKELGIKLSKRDEFTNQIIKDKNLKLVAIAGTHGKTTTTAMVIWLLRNLGIGISHSVGAKMAFGDMGHYEPGSEYFVYECDEFDRNFLAFHPSVAIISGVSYDHHEVYPTQEEYFEAFRQFIGQSQKVILWQEDLERLNFKPSNAKVLESGDKAIQDIKLEGAFNRLDAWAAVMAVHDLLDVPTEKLVEKISQFPGLHRRMEEIVPGLYTDEAHTPDKIRGAMSAALETAGEKPVVVVYEPLTNRRQHYMKDDYKDCFKGAKKVYWLPSYLAREDPDQAILPPEELIKRLAEPSLAEPSKLDDELNQTIQDHLKNGDMVFGMAGGGGGSLDEWLRATFKTQG